MNMNLLDKFTTIFKYMFSSSMSLGLFIFIVLLFVLTIFNLKYKNKIITVLSAAMFISLLLGTFITYTNYTKSCIDGFVKWIMNYIYFPSTVVYFFIMLFVLVVLVFSIFSKKLTKFKKIFNYSICTIMYFLFINFVSLSASSGVDLSDINSLYENNIILSLIQVSNLLLVFWIIFTLFYKLFLFFKKKFD